MIKLKNLGLQSAVIQSPMAGCTDLAYRLLSRSFGMEFAFLEMVSAEALIRRHASTQELMKTLPEDKPLGAQLVGCRPEAMAEAAQIVESLGYDLLDLNLGCPVPKIYGNGAGSALLAKPQEAKHIFRRVVRSVKKIPVTVKMRLGIKDPSGQEAIQIAQIAQDSGINALTVHGRTRLQGYSGKADYEAIRRVKDSVSIPVIGNGDVVTGQDALRMKKIAGVDGIMIGRAGLGNPWVFQEISTALQGLPQPGEPTLEEKKEAVLRHLDLELSHRDEKTALLHMRRISGWYFKNWPGVSEFRGQINTCQSIDAMRHLLEDFGKPNAKS